MLLALSTAVDQHCYLLPCTITQSIMLFFADFLNTDINPDFQYIVRGQRASMGIFVTWSSKMLFSYFWSLNTVKITEELCDLWKKKQPEERAGITVILYAQMTTIPML